MSVFTKVVANFITTLASNISVGGVTATLQSNVTKDGETLPNGYYCLTVNQGKANEQHLLCTLTGGVMTEIQTVNRLGVITPGAAKTASINDEVKITDYLNLLLLVQDVTTLNTIVDGLIISGAPDASTSIRGVSMLTFSPEVVLGTATVTIASPAVVTETGHGLVVGDSIKFSTIGSLPTGMVAGVTYYVIATGLTANTFQFSASYNGTAVNTSGAQSGTHTLTRTTPRAVADTDPRIPTTNQSQFLSAITGMMLMYGGASAPSGFLLCDGTPYLFTTHPSLFGVLGIQYGLGAGTAVVFNTTTDNVELTGHGFTNGQRLYFSAGTLPAGVVAGTPYYVINAAANTFQISATVGGALIDLTTAGTAVLVHTTFRVPDMRGAVGIGSGQRNIATLPFTSANVTLSTVGVGSTNTGADLINHSTLSGVNAIVTGEEVIPNTTENGWTAGVKYYARRLNDTQFQLHTSRAGAIANTGLVDINNTITGAIFSRRVAIAVTDHDLLTGTEIILSTAGVLPTGLSAGTYYAIRFSPTAIYLAPTKDDAIAGRALAATAIGSGSSSFVARADTIAQGSVGGRANHALSVAELAKHNHLLPNQTSSSGAQSSALVDGSSLFDYALPGYVSDNAGGDAPHNNMQPYVAINYIIKT